MAAQGFLNIVGGQFKQVLAVLSGGSSGQANLIPALDANGRLDVSFMPSGIGADTVSITASEALSAGAWVNVYNNAGTPGVRNADNSAANAGKIAHGFVLSAVASGAAATVYMSGQNTAVTGLTAGDIFLGTAGASLTAAPTGSGATVQKVGVAASATDAEFKPGPAIVLA